MTAVLIENQKNQRQGRGGRRPGAGRPRGSNGAKTLELRVSAGEHAVAAIAALVNVMQHGRSESARVAAAIALLDRAYGKPRQSLEHSGPGGQPIALKAQVDPTDVRARIRARLTGIARRIGERSR